MGAQVCGLDAESTPTHRWPHHRIHRWRRRPPCGPAEIDLRSPPRVLDRRLGHSSPHRVGQLFAGSIRGSRDNLDLSTALPRVGSVVVGRLRGSSIG